MAAPSIPQEWYENLAQQVFHWFTRKDVSLWFHGEYLERDRRTEIVLKRLKDKGKLVAVQHGKEIAYTVPRRVRSENQYRKIDHGLKVSRMIVLLKRSRLECFTIPEYDFYRMHIGVIPDFGIKYLNKDRELESGSILVGEFCSTDNFRKTNRMTSKLHRYRVSIGRIEVVYRGPVIVLFSIDVSRDRVRTFIERYVQPEEPFYFIDYQTFASIRVGNHLTEYAYFWKGVNGIGEYPLTGYERTRATTTGTAIS